MDATIDIHKESGTPMTIEAEQVDISEKHTTSPSSNSVHTHSTEEQSSEISVFRPQGARLVIILTSLFFSLLLASLDQSIVSTASPTIAADFGALDQIGWIATSYLLPMTTCQPLFGKLADLFGRKKTLLVSIFIFILGSGLSGASQNMPMLCAMRGVQGFGAAGIAPLVMIVLGEVVPLEKRAKYQGLIALCWVTGTLAGPTVGGVLVDHAAWRWIFFLNLPVGAITMAMIIFFLQEPATYCKVDESFRTKLLKIDFLGVTLFVTGVACFLLATQWAGARFEWNTPVIIGLYCGTVVLISLALLVEVYVSKEPFLHLALFKDRDNLALYWVAFFVGCCFFAGIYFIPVYFQVAHGDSPTISGVKLLAFLLPVDIVSMLTGFYLSATGRYRPLFWIGGIFMAIGCGLCSLLSYNTAIAEQIGFMIIAGMGAGACLQNIYVVAQANVAISKIAPAISLVSFVVYFGFASGIAISNAIFNNILRSHLAQLGLPEAQILEAQASFNFVRSVSPDQRGQIEDAYIEALRWIFISMAAYGVLCFIGALAFRPKRIKKSGI